MKTLQGHLVFHIAFQGKAEPLRIFFRLHTVTKKVCVSTPCLDIRQETGIPDLLVSDKDVFRVMDDYAAL